MADQKVIAVVGATGAQGGGLARAILADRNGPLSLRALVRDPSTEAARALASQGAELVTADLDDPTSVARGFAGAHGAFCVTFFWAHLSVDKEQAQAKTMADAAKRAGLHHVIWSTLEDTRLWVPLSDDRMPTLGGKYKVPHFDGKGASDQFFAGLPVTYLLTSFYWDNLIHFGMGPKRGEDGTLAFVLPMDDQPLPSIAAEDIGRCAYGIFQRGPEFTGKRVGIAGEHLTGTQIASSLTRYVGEPVRYQPIPPAVYRTFGFPGADDLGNMFQFNRDFSADFCAARSVAVSRELNPTLQTFDQWLAGSGLKV